MWYTNGAIDLKLYFKKAKKEYGEKITEDSFNKDYTALRGSQEIFYPFKNIN